MAHRRRQLSSEEKVDIIAKTNGHCHICGQKIDTPSWDHHPETIRRILFLGVIANQKGYKNPSTGDESKQIRLMRARRLAENLKRRRRLSTEQTAKHLRRFNKFEDQVVRLMQELKKVRRSEKISGKTNKVRWTEVVDGMLQDGDHSVPPRYKEAYEMLVSYEEPGPEEVATSREAYSDPSPRT
jgi:hypothetical protein